MHETELITMNYVYACMWFKKDLVAISNKFKDHADGPMVEVLKVWTIAQRQNIWLYN